LRAKGYCFFPDEKEDSHRLNCLQSKSGKPTDIKEKDWIEGSVRKSLWEMLLSDDQAHRMEAVGLIEENEEHIALLGHSLEHSGQVNPVLVREGPKDKETKQKTYKMVEGAQRVLAKLYQWASSGGRKNGDTVSAIISTKKMNALDARITSFVANTMRRAQNPMEILDNLRIFRDQDNLTLEEIGRTTGMTIQDIKDHLSLALLPPGLQNRIRNGSMSKAAGIAKARAISAQTMTEEEAEKEVKDQEDAGIKPTAARTGAGKNPTPGGLVKKRTKKAITDLFKSGKTWNDAPLTTGMKQMLLWCLGEENPEEALENFKPE